MSSYAERVGKLRPLASRADVARVYSDGERPPYPEAPWRGFTARYGPKVKHAPDGAAAPDTLEMMVLDASFPPTVDFYGFSIDMPFEAAREPIVRLGLVRMPLREGLPNDVQSFSGQTPEGFEINLLFKGNLAEIQLYRPNYWPLFEMRQAFLTARAEAETKRRSRMNAWKAITDDDDAMLMDWANHCKPWNDYSESEFVKYAKWLRTASVDERHMAAQCWNWDYGYAPLIWIYRRPDCDLATALHIFFGCQPSYYLKFEGSIEQVKCESSHALEGFQMMMELKQRIERGAYKRTELYFDIATEMEYIMRYNPSAAQRAATMPSNLKDEYLGRKITRKNEFGGLRMPQLQID